MKKIFTAFPACLPLMAMALNTWEPPKEEPPQQNPGSERETTPPGKKAKMGETPKYLAGAAPEVDGKVVFKLEEDAPGMTAEQWATGPTGPGAKRRQARQTPGQIQARDHRPRGLHIRSRAQCAQREILTP